MANQTSATAGGGGFLRILGIIYLVKMIRRRRRERGQLTEEPGGPSGGDRDRRPEA